MLGAPRSNQRLADRLQHPAKFEIRLTQTPRRLSVEITLAVDGARQAGALRSPYDDGSKEPPFERVNPDVAVPDGVGVDQAADDDRDTVEPNPFDR